VGVGTIASQFPYGRLIGLAPAGLGMLLAGLSLLGLEERRRWVGWAGVGANAFVLLLLVALPGWLGISTWTPAADPAAGPKPVTAVGRDGGLPSPADWVNAHRAVWQHDDVRVAVSSVGVGPLDPAGPPAAKRKDQR